MSKVWDAIVIGAGPAGASCAVWLRQLGFEPLLLESASEPGGLLRSNSYLDVWTVTSPGQTGQDMAQQLARQVEISGVQLRCNARVTRVEHDGTCFTVTYQLGAAPQTDGSGGSTLLRHSAQSGHSGQEPACVIDRATNLVVASGVRARTPHDLKPDARLDSHAGPHSQTRPDQHDGVLIGPGEHVMNHEFAGLSVAILGGGDNAFENYLFVKSRSARSARIYARTVRAQQQFVRQVPPEDVCLGAVAFDPKQRSVNGQTYDRVLVFYGWQANAEFLDDIPVKRDARGFLDVDPLTAQTSVAGLYAIGEVTQRMHPCVPTAMADGVVAAKAIERRLTNR